MSLEHLERWIWPTHYADWNPRQLGLWVLVNLLRQLLKMVVVGELLIASCRRGAAQHSAASIQFSIPKNSRYSSYQRFSSFLFCHGDIIFGPSKINFSLTEFIDKEITVSTALFVWFGLRRLIIYVFNELDRPHTQYLATWKKRTDLFQFDKYSDDRRFSFLYISFKILMPWCLIRPDKRTIYDLSARSYFSCLIVVEGEICSSWRFLNDSVGFFSRLMTHNYT